MKKVAIVGGTSSLAKSLIPVLKKNGEVVTLGRENCDIYCDLQAGIDSIVIPENIDTVVHIAAAFKGNTDEEIIETEDVNSIGTLKICMASKKASVKHLVLISSQSAVLDENSPYYGVYSISKKHSEELAAYYCKSNNIELTILRPSQIYDEKGEFRKHQPLIYLMADNAQDGKDIAIYGQNDALRNYIHAEDLAEIIVRTIECQCKGVYSCNYPKDYRLSEIASAAQTSFNNGGKIVFLDDKADIPDNIFDNQVELYEKIGFYPQIDIETGMKKIAEYRKGCK